MRIEYFRTGDYPQCVEGRSCSCTLPFYSCTPRALNFINILIKNSEAANCGSCSSRIRKFHLRSGVFDASSRGFSRGHSGQPLGLRVLQDSSVSLANYRSGRVREDGARIVVDVVIPMLLLAFVHVFCFVGDERLGLNLSEEVLDAVVSWNLQRILPILFLESNRKCPCSE